MAVGKNGLVTALDVGSTKVCCFIARPDGSGGMRVIGIGHQNAKGMRAGTVVDIDAALLLLFVEYIFCCKLKLFRELWHSFFFF